MMYKRLLVLVCVCLITVCSVNEAHAQFWKKWFSKEETQVEAPKPIEIKKEQAPTATEEIESSDKIEQSESTMKVEITTIGEPKGAFKKEEVEKRAPKKVDVKKLSTQEMTEEEKKQALEQTQARTDQMKKIQELNKTESSLNNIKRINEMNKQQRQINEINKLNKMQRKQDQLNRINSIKK